LELWLSHIVCGPDRKFSIRLSEAVKFISQASHLIHRHALALLVEPHFVLSGLLGDSTRIAATLDST
jgi:hypothetical protein